ncbi:hypothetical protein RD110_08830 [Rhodoferax koreense]|uniref:Uncharacterized protein n=2 Tax=Rhodoferax koreensis TaxID=1842727 RepID=A0A1P8JU52_9BURK|nr:hypothetical protein RD110_08830 [Rhodoferax koreense]
MLRAKSMLRAKFLITLAVIGGIHQFYRDDDTDLATMHLPAVTCVGHSASPQDAKGLDMDAIGVQGRDCADVEVRPDAVNG